MEKSKVMERPNIFEIATKELSQDAFITWLLKWADDSYKDTDEDLHQCGKEFISTLIKKQNPNFSESINKVEAKRQKEKIDVWAEVNDKYLIIIEDKTNSRDHSKQLEKYKEIAEKWCQENFENSEKFEVLPNWTRIAPISYQSNKYRKELRLENKIVFFYGGNIGHAQNMINLVDLAIAMKPFPEAHFLFVGKGDEVTLILEKQKEYDLTNVTYLPAVDQDEYFQMLSEFDVGLFNLHPNHLTHNFPGKLLGYMEYSKPILGCVNKGNDLKEIINEAKAGFIFENTDKEELYMAAQQLLQSKELRERMGNNSFNLLNQKFDVEITQKHIEDFLFKYVV